MRSVRGDLNHCSERCARRLRRGSHGAAAARGANATGSVDGPEHDSRHRAGAYGCHCKDPRWAKGTNRGQRKSAQPAAVVGDTRDIQLAGGAPGVGAAGILGSTTTGWGHTNARLSVHRRVWGRRVVGAAATGRTE